MKIKEYSFKSATGVCNIRARRFTPDNDDVKAVVVMHHGMAEHSDRYLGFFEDMTSRGYVMFMHDMANHGKSNVNKEETGYFGDKNGYKALIADFKTVFDIAKKEYPNSKIIIAGHSMGSFVARCFTAKFADAGFDGAIYIGTGGPNPAAGVGDLISKTLAKTKGTKHKSKMIDKLSFGSFNNKFEKRTNFDWLTKDNEIVDKYIADEMCGFLFTVTGMNDLIHLISISNSKEWYERLDKNLPILITSGEMDPVGDYGKGLDKVYKKLLSTGHVRTTLKLYPNDRHEILNELDKENVYSDIDKWITENVIK